MDSPFIYDKYVTGKNFIGRKTEALALSNLIQQGENVVLSEAPKTGKMSLIQQTLFNMRVGGKQFHAAQFSVLDIRTVASFFTRFGSTIIRMLSNTPAEYAEIAQRYLGGTRFVFDAEEFSESDEVISCSGEPDSGDIAAMLRMPYRLSEDRGQRIVLIINDFQNVLLTEDADLILGPMETVAQEEPKGHFSYIFSGSMINAMKQIFKVRGFFHRNIEQISLKTVDEREITEYISRGFSSSGKVSEKDLLIGVCRTFRNHLWYINHFISICDSMSKGYIMDPVLQEAMNSILAIHEPKFHLIMNDLTTHQVNLLKAIIDGHSEFSSGEVIRRYCLNSSANVKRVKDALMKKEIITFTDQDDPVIIDPLFEYWVRKHYFNKKY